MKITRMKMLNQARSQDLDPRNLGRRQDRSARARRQVWAETLCQAQEGEFTSPNQAHRKSFMSQ